MHRFSDELLKLVCVLCDLAAHIQDARIANASASASIINFGLERIFVCRAMFLPGPLIGFLLKNRCRSTFTSSISL